MNKQQSRIEPAQGELRIPVDLPADFVPTESGGLTAAQAARRAEAGQANRQTRDPGKSTGQIVAENLFTLFNLLNFALAICLALVGSWRNMLFLGVVFSNTLIGTVQSIRARQTLNKLRLLQTRNAHPIRDGQEIECPPDELVLGDLVVLRAGEQLPADAIVREGRCAADESLLTGESEPVVRQEGDWLMSGSFLTEGKVTAQLAAVGDDSYAARLMRSARVIRTPKSELMTELNRLVSLVSRILVPIGILLFCREYFLQHAPIQQAVPEAVAAMIGMIPEGLILLTSVALLAGVVKLGKRQTLVQELFGIESLARVDVLCVDKTGTLTTGEMTLDETIPMEADEAELNAAAARFLGAFEAASGTLRALADAIPAAENTALATLPFSSARKKSAASFSDGTTLILGAPSFVLDAVPARVTEASEQGYRVLALAEAEGAISGTELPPVRRCLGLFLLRDTLRPSVKDTLAWFSREGVSVRVLSGDDPRTVSAVARTLELPGADRIADCSLLSDDELRAAAADKVIFGRLTPARKQILVEALKAEGHSVAMTGDGVNDIPSLKAADCSIAIGGGAEATEHAAQIVLLDRDFNSLPAVVAEGRRVIGNITRTASLYLVKTLYSFVLGLIMVFLPLRYPFQPIHLTLISALSIGTPSFFLALEPSSERASGHFLKRILLRAVPGALAVVCCAIASMILSHCGTGHTVAATMAAVAAGWIGLANLALTCRPFTRLRVAVCIAMVIGYVGALAFLPKLFLLEIYAMTGTNWLQLAAITVGGLAVLLVGTKALTPAVRRLEH
ncbi:MAG: HAD-IC family P-type ATPase [Oscillospiraceae bacterium]|nr:HAD-IC family P-type ATPase [Oscillospiraceae bacterium]